MIADIRLPTGECARDAWTFWSDVFSLPGDTEYVKGVNGASVELHRIHNRGFPKSLMEKWLREWPTQIGLDVFLNLRQRLCNQ